MDKLRLFTENLPVRRIAGVNYLLLVFDRIHRIQERGFYGLKRLPDAAFPDLDNKDIFFLESQVFIFHESELVENDPRSDDEADGDDELGDNKKTAQSGLGRTRFEAPFQDLGRTERGQKQRRIAPCDKSDQKHKCDQAGNEPGHLCNA